MTAPGLSDAQQRLVDELINAFDGNAYRTLVAVGDALELSLAYVDRFTVETYVNRALTENEWARVNEAFSAMDFDSYVGDDENSYRLGWVQTVLNVVAEDGTVIQLEDPA